MNSLEREYDNCQSKSHKSKKGDGDAVFYGNTSDSKGPRGGQSKKEIECYNCKKCGHVKANCWAKGGGKEGQGLKSKKSGEGSGANIMASTTVKCQS